MEIQKNTLVVIIVVLILFIVVGGFFYCTENKNLIQQLETSFLQQLKSKETGKTEGDLASANFTPGRLLVRFKDNVPEEEQKKLLKGWGFTVEKEIKQIKVKVISVPEQAEESLAKALSKNPRIDYAEVDGMAETLFVPNDPYFTEQWGMTKIQAPGAWDITKGSNDIQIAILDTGIDLDHSDLASKIISSINFSTAATVDDFYGHGTHVAGIAAAVTNNSVGVAGLGFNATLMNVKVLADNGSGAFSGIASGIIWAADNGAEVINMSLGGGGGSLVLEDAVNYAWNKGVIVVAAAGNNGSSIAMYPAFYTNCIAVAATGQTDEMMLWSNYGDWVDVAAPGGGIYSTIRGTTDAYGYMAGTSMASPHVAGLAGLLSAVATDINNNGFKNDEIRFLIENTTDSFNWGTKPILHGRINAFSAVKETVDNSPRTLTGTITGTGSGTVRVNPPDVNYTGSFTEDYNTGTPVTLTATPDANSVFTGWSGACTGKEACNLFMIVDSSVTANFDMIKTLTISSTAGGSVFTPGEGNFTYKKDEKVRLLVSADLNYRFVGWTGDVENIYNTKYGETTITMADDYSIIANFGTAPECITYNGYTYCRGFRSTDPQGASCNAACSARGYTCPIGDNMFRSRLEIADVAVELGLLSLEESRAWYENINYYSPFIRKILSTAAKSIYYDPTWNQNCTYDPKSGSTYEYIKICRCEGASSTYALSVTTAGTGSGTVVSSPEGINCGNFCSASYNYGTSVTLTATPAAGSTFAGWSGACTGTGPCIVNMTSNKSVTATFNAVPTYTLSINSSPTGIYITGNPSTYSGTTNYTKTNIPAGTSVSLTAPATSSNYEFSYWSGCISATVRTINFSMPSSNTTCTANYNEVYQPAPPPIPTGLTCKTISSSQIDVSWNAASGATGYKIYRCTGITCIPTTLVRTQAGTFWSNIGLAGYTTYRYKVKAYNSGGESDYSVTASCTTQDNILPVVSITSPLNNSTISGTISVNVSASDNVGVTKVELYKDGVLFATDDTLPYSFFWDTTKDTNSIHKLEAKAYDAARNTSVSTITVTVYNNLTDITPPTVSITSPIDGQTVPSKGKLLISATASDNVKVTQIDLLVDNRLITSCYNVNQCFNSFVLNKLRAGTHTITANAFDARNNMGKATITIKK